MLLDTYKNSAPKIVCILGKGAWRKLNNKKYREYSITVRNVSNKTLHDLNINLQDELESLQVKDSDITKGLRYHLSEEYNEYNIGIPFLSKNDEFTSIILVEETSENENKPFIALRSPEKFKKTYKETKEKQKEAYNLECIEDSNMYDDEDLDYTVVMEKSDLKRPRIKAKNRKNNKGFFMNRKLIFGVIGVLIIAYIAVVGIERINKSTLNNDVTKGISSTQSEKDSNNNSTSVNSQADDNSIANTSENKDESHFLENNSDSSVKKADSSKEENDSKKNTSENHDSTKQTESSSEGNKKETVNTKKANESADVNQSKNTDSKSNNSSEKGNTEKSNTESSSIPQSSENK